MSGDQAFSRRALLAAAGTGTAAVVSTGIAVAQSDDDENATGTASIPTASTDPLTDAEHQFNTGTDRNTNTNTNTGTDTDTDTPSDAPTPEQPAEPASEPSRPAPRDQGGRDGTGAGTGDDGPVDHAEIRTRTPATTSENGVTFMFRDCSKIRVMGDMRAVERVRVDVVQYHNGMPSDDKFFYNAGWHFSRDVATEGTGGWIVTGAAALDADWRAVAHASNPRVDACRRVGD